MKSIIQQSIAFAAVLFTVAGSIPESQAANVRLKGSGYYRLGSEYVFSGRNGKQQSGRYSYLGSDYYHKIEYGIDYVTNTSSYKSGSLSYEFWALPFYGATSGIILMTRGLSPLSSGQRYVNLYKYGWGISLNLYRFPEQNIWEYIGRDAWRFRDSLAFSRKTLL
jgi:hypothetical protein